MRESSRSLSSHEGWYCSSYKSFRAFGQFRNAEVCISAASQSVSEIIRSSRRGALGQRSCNPISSKTMFTRQRGQKRPLQARASTQASSHDSTAQAQAQWDVSHCPKDDWNRCPHAHSPHEVGDEYGALCELYGVAVCVASTSSPRGISSTADEEMPRGEDVVPPPPTPACWRWGEDVVPML